MMLLSIAGFSFLLIAASLFCISSCASDTLTPGELLSDGPDGGTFLISAGDIFKLGFFSPNGSDHRYIGIWYNEISVQTVVWVANRRRPITGLSGRLSVSPSGTLVIADQNSTVFWSSSTPGALNNPVARVLDDGNFVVREAGGDADTFPPAWQSFDYPGDTMLLGMKLGWNLTSGFNRNSTSWRSDSDPSPGDFVLGLDLNGAPQLFLWSGSRKYWRGGPWNGVGFTGAPEMPWETVVSWGFLADEEEVVFWYENRSPGTGPSPITRMYLAPSGMVQRLMWNEAAQSWTLIRFVGRDECAGWSPCGSNSLCSPDMTPMCSCLHGFHPRNPRDWNSMVGFDGCVRKTNLDCANQTDGFIKYSSLKLPDTSTSTVDWRVSVNLEDCRASCLRNCSCTAYASANISAGSGSGCIIWTGDLSDMKVYHGALGQDLYVRVAASDLGSSHSRRRRLVVAIITLSSVLPFLLATFACYIWRRKRTSRFVDEDQQTEQGNDLNLPLFDLGSIVDATGNFSDANKLGEGGFGPVYKGTLREGQEIAVKRLSMTSTQGVDEFKNEVKSIAKLQHRNLVRLLGCCTQGGERILIYEYLPNGSLDAVLFDKTKVQMLDWNRRYNIIMGIARGLLYLHQDSRFRIIHRDLKASNILLDKDLNPKISDFGMAKTVGGDETMGKTKRIVGTYGYMSPEYAMCGTFSIKSDIFSFGVLILEIITGKRNSGFYHFSQQQNLLEYIWSVWKERNALESVDRSLGDSFSADEVLRCINIGLLCVQERPMDRPAMSSVIPMLSGDNPQLPEPSQPGFIIARDTSETNSSLSREGLLSRNNLTVTTLEGR